MQCNHVTGDSAAVAAVLKLQTPVALPVVPAKPTAAWTWLEHLALTHLIAPFEAAGERLDFLSVYALSTIMLFPSNIPH